MIEHHTSRRFLNPVLLSLLAAAAGVACTVVNGGGNDGGTMQSDGGSSSSSGGSGSSSGAGGDGGGSSSGSSSSSSSSGGSSSSSGGGPITSCSTATLFAGDPNYNGQPTDRPMSGTGILADPPLLWHNIIFDGSRLYTQDGAGTVWTSDLSVASPVETVVAGFTDENSAALPFNAGPCAMARMAHLRSIALMPDKSLVVSDWLANAVLHISHPTDASCTVDYYAGNNQPNDDVGSTAPPMGDMDGPGAQALLNGPGALTTDDSGNVYFFDTGNLKLKKIGNDAQHTVKTLATLPMNNAPYALNNLTRIGSTIYGVGNDVADGYVLGFDSMTGAMTTVVQGDNSVFQPVPSSVVVSGIATDGQGLIVAGSGYVWYVTLAGKVTNLAGSGVMIDFPPMGYDPKMPQPAMNFVLPDTFGDTNGGAMDHVAYQPGAIFVRGVGQGTSYFIEKIACP